MVCIPCIVIPVVLWLFHKYIQPFILKFWNPWEKKGIDNKSALSSDCATAEALPDPKMADSKEYQYIQTQIKAHPVMVFSKPSCSYCKMAKEVLDKTGVDYTVEEIDGRPDCDKLQDVFAQMTGARTVPRVFVGGKCFGGGTDIYTLHNQGRLVELMKEVGATFKKGK